MHRDSPGRGDLTGARWHISQTRASTVDGADAEFPPNAVAGCLGSPLAATGAQRLGRGGLVKWHSRGHGFDPHQLHQLQQQVSGAPPKTQARRPCSRASGLQLVRVLDPSPIRDGEPGSANLDIQLPAHLVFSADTSHSRTAKYSSP